MGSRLYVYEPLEEFVDAFDAVGQPPHQQVDGALGEEVLVSHVVLHLRGRLQEVAGGCRFGGR